MSDNRISRRAIAAFLLVGAIGFAFFLATFDRAFPEASIDLRLSRHDVADRSREFLAGQGYDLTGYRVVVTFKQVQDKIDFLERNLGLAAANPIFRDTVAAFRWRARWFKERQETEYAVDYTPDGRFVWFWRKLPAKDPGPRLPEAAARAVAEKFLGETAGFDLSRYVFIEHKTHDRPARLDHTFAWRLNGFDVAGGEVRLQATVQGDRVGSMADWLRIPEQWERDQEAGEARRKVLARADDILVVIVEIALFLAFFYRVYRRDVRWRAALAVGGIGAVLAALAKINDTPLALADYATTESFATFWTAKVVEALAIGLGTGLGLIAVFGGGESVGRAFLGDRPHAGAAFTRAALGSGDAARQVALGYGLAFAATGYVTLYYLLGRYVGIWTPVDVPVGDVLSAYVPALSALLTGFSAGLEEEFTFRLFAIAVLLRLTKRPGIAVVVPAVVWGFAHTMYPQEPIWARGVEVGLVGIAYGAIFLRYGLLTTFTSHVLYNTFVGVFPQIRTGRPDLVAGGLIALAVPVLGLLVVRRLVRTVATRPAAVETPALDAIPVAEVPVDRLPTSQPISGRRLAVVVLSAVAVFAAWRLVPKLDFYGRPPDVRLSPTEAAARAETRLRELGFDPAGYRRVTTFADKTTGLGDYAIDHLGPRRVFDEYRSFYTYSPRWTTRWFREQDVRAFEVTVDDAGGLLAFDAKLADIDPGAMLPPEAAERLGSDFLRAHVSDAANWDRIETKKHARPDRWDYDLTFRDRTYHLGDQERRLKVTVSGDRVTAYGRPKYKAPEAWSRARDEARGHWRNAVRSSAAEVLWMATVLFVLVQIVLLFHRRHARRSDARGAAWAALAFAAAATVGIVNAIPSIWVDYAAGTAASARSFFVERLARDFALDVLGMATGAFLLVVVLQMACRAWFPEVGDLRRFLSPLHPRRWGDAAALQGVWIGAAISLLGEAIDGLAATARGVLVPGTFEPSSGASSVDFNRFSETLGSLPDGLTGSLGIACFLFAALTARRFLRNRAVLAVVLAAYVLIQGTESLSARDLLVTWGKGAVEVVVLYFLVTRVTRWNLMAYLTWAYLDKHDAFTLEWARYFGSGPAFLSVAVQRTFWTFAPVGVVLIVALIQRRRRPAPTPASS